MLDEMRLISLGSGSTIPRHRSPASVYVQADGDRYLVDAPEGVQHQLLHLGIGLKIDTIFITNRAKRSVLGLPGLLNTLSFYADREKPLTIYCPPKIHEQVKNITGWFDSTNYVLNVKELVPGVFEHVEEYYRIDTLDTSPYSTYGLKFTERNQRGEFDRQKAESLGVPAGPKFSKLCDGEPVEAEDGSIVEPDEVLSSAPDPLSVVFSGRTEPVDSVRNAAQNADVLVHDAATFERFSLNNDRASVSDAVGVANDSQPGTLLLTRLTNNIAHRSDDYLADDAKEHRQGTYDIEIFSAGTQLSVMRNQVEIDQITPD